MFKLISLDLDGTLVDTSGQISTRNRDAVAKCHNQGIETVIATGRPPRFTFGMLDESLIRDYVVCYNGAHIYYQNLLIYKRYLSESVVEGLLEFFQEDRLGLEVGDCLHVNFEMEAQWHNIQHKKLADLTAKSQVAKVIVLNDGQVPMDRLFNRFGATCNILMTDKGRLIEIMDKAVSKANAVAWIAKREGLTMDQVVAFGDDANDREILEAVGLGVAMGNAIEPLKACADEITLSNDDDGVAVVIERILNE